MRVELYVVYSTARVDMWGRLTITNISYKKLAHDLYKDFFSRVHRFNTVDHAFRKKWAEV